MNNIKSLRLQKGIKQSELAKFLNIAQGTLSYWEQGKYDIDNNSLKKLSSYFNVSTDYLLGITDDPTPPMKTNNNTDKNTDDPTSSKKIDVVEKFMKDFNIPPKPDTVLLQVLGDKGEHTTREISKEQWEIAKLMWEAMEKEKENK